MTYNYLEAITTDIKDYIDNEINFADFDDIEELEKELQEILFEVDSVTGNASGSYTFCRATAKEYVLDNTDLLRTACDEFCCKDEFAEKFFADEWEWMDVIIRCFLLPRAISVVIGEISDDFTEAKTNTVNH